MFRVVDAELDDDAEAVVHVKHAELLGDLQINPGDFAILKGSKRKETACVILTDDSVDASEIRMNKVS